MEIVQIASCEEDIIKCWEVLFCLRPHLIKAEFVETIQRMQGQGYTLTYIERDGKAIVAAGFEMGEKLHRGKYLYIDDLTTLPQYRKQGLAIKMLQWIEAYAQKQGCSEVCLDSGSKPERYDAHRLYLSNGFNITSFHFVKRLT